MESLSLLFFNLCFFAALVGSIYADSDSTQTIETSKNSAYDMRDDKIYRADLPKSDSECSSINEHHVKDAAQLGQQSAKGPSYLNGATNAFTTLVVHSPSGSSIDDTRHSERIGNREDDASRSDRKEKSAVDLSHDVPLNPNLMPAHPTWQAEKSDVDYRTTASVKDTPGDTKSHGNIKSRSIDSSLRSSDLESDLDAAEDRYQSPYQSQYPYWNRGQFPNQRYRAGDRREPYRNYLRYPVFPGK